VLIRRSLRVAALVAIGVALINGSPPARATSHAVEIRNNAYAPPDLTVAVGDTVVWHNYDGETHSVVGGPINSPDIAPGAEFSWTFDSASEVSYTCRFHPYMTGVVRATSAGAAAPPPSADAPSADAPSDDAPAEPDGDAPTTTLTTMRAVPPPAAFMALASATPLVPEIASPPPTTAAAPLLTPPTTPTPTPTPTTVVHAALGLIDRGGHDHTGIAMVGFFVVLIVGSVYSVRLLRKESH
jgi:plastocyanin